MLDGKLLDILVCPNCKGGLRHDRERRELLCLAEGLAYPVRDGVPVMLADEAREMPLEERDRHR